MPGTCLSDGRPSLRQTRPMGLPALATEILLDSALFVNDRCFPEDQWRVRRKFRLYTESYKSQCSPASHHLCFPAFVFILMVESLLHTELHSWHLCCGSAVLSLSDSATLWAAAQGIFCVTPVGCHFLLQGIFAPWDQTCISRVSCTAGRFFTVEPPEKPSGFSTRCIFFLHFYLKLDYVIEFTVSGDTGFFL